MRDMYLEKAISNKYNDPCVLAAIALFLEDQKQHQRAAELSNKCLKIDPDNIIAKKLLAEHHSD